MYPRWPGSPGKRASRTSPASSTTSPRSRRSTRPATRSCWPTSRRHGLLQAGQDQVALPRVRLYVRRRQGRQGLPGLQASAGILRDGGGELLSARRRRDNPRPRPCKRPGPFALRAARATDAASRGRPLLMIQYQPCERADARTFRDYLVSLCSPIDSFLEDHICGSTVYRIIEQEAEIGSFAMEPNGLLTLFHLRRAHQRLGQHVLAEIRRPVQYRIGPGSHVRRVLPQPRAGQLPRTEDAGILLRRQRNRARRARHRQSTSSTDRPGRTTSPRSRPSAATSWMIPPRASANRKSASDTSVGRSLPSD